ncbi:MAG TPA: acyl-CoA carboxylase epsilon subunit [Rubrobacteraceae bacterium]
MRIEPDPNPEEVAAIMAALAATSGGPEEPEESAALYRSRWRLAGLLGHAPPRGMKLDGALWSYSRWEGMV